FLLASGRREDLDREVDAGGGADRRRGGAREGRRQRGTTDDVAGDDVERPASGTVLEAAAVVERDDRLERLLPALAVSEGGLAGHALRVPVRRARVDARGRDELRQVARVDRDRASEDREGGAARARRRAGLEHVVERRRE